MIYYEVSLFQGKHHNHLWTKHAQLLSHQSCYKCTQSSSRIIDMTQLLLTARAYCRGQGLSSTAHIIAGGEKQASGENDNAKSSTHPNFIRAVSRVFASSTDSLRSPYTSWFGCWLFYFTGKRERYGRPRGMMLRSNK